LFSSGTHYSIRKGINLLSLRCMQVPVDEKSGVMSPRAIEAVIAEAVAGGVRAFIVVPNMSTTTIVTLHINKMSSTEQQGSYPCFSAIIYLVTG